MKIKLKNILLDCDSITAMASGKKKTYERGSNGYIAICDIIEKTWKNPREMLALSVAMDDLTRSYTGIAIEFNFNSVMKYDSLQFEKLFMRLSDYFVGANFERYYGGKYQGRCFYLNLDRGVKLLCQKVLELA